MKEIEIQRYYVSSDCFSEQIFETQQHAVSVGGSDITYRVSQEYPCIVVISHKNKEYPCIVRRETNGSISVSLSGYTYPLNIFSSKEIGYGKIIGESETMKSNVVKIVSPMPGLIKAVNVKSGQSVKKGETIFILEAMKMENSIKALTNGTINEIFVHSEEVVEKSCLLCTIMPSI